MKYLNSLKGITIALFAAFNLIALSSARAAVNTADLELIDSSNLDFAHNGGYTNRRTREITDRYILTNVGGQTLDGPFILEVVITPSDVTSVLNADDVTTTGNALINFTQTTLAPGESINYELKFSNPGRNRFTYTQKIYRPATSGPSNTPPNAINDTGYTVNEDEAIITAASVLSNDTDEDGDPLTAVLENDVTNGTLVLNTNGTFDYTPTPNFNGTDSFTYFANDGTADSVTSATVTITINPVNDAPVAADDSGSTDEDSAVTIDVLSNDSDIDGDSLTVTSATAANGAVNINADGTLEYTPSANFNGSDTITYEISDGNGEVSTALVTVTVNPVNDIPTANTANFTIDEDTVLTNSLTATDDDGDDLIFVLDTEAASGTTSVNPDGTFTYTPDADFNGTDSFVFTAGDAFVSSVPSVVTITINPVNDAPLTNVDEATTNEDEPVIIDVLSNDSDADLGDSLSIASIADEIGGSATINPDNTVTFTPDSDFNGVATFSYIAQDNNSAPSASTRVFSFGVQKPLIF